jgi:hypothetical protein
MNFSEISKRFKGIFNIDTEFGRIVIPEAFEVKVKSWLGNDEQAIEKAKRQTIIKVYNKFLFEEMIYNPLRGKRPQSKSGISEKN